MVIPNFNLVPAASPMNPSLSSRISRFLPMTRPKVDRTWVLLGLALGAGLLAALAARHYLSGQVAAIEAKARGETVRLVVARSDLAVGAALSADNLAVREVPLDWAQSTAVRPEEFQRVQGERLGQPLRSGEMLMWSQIEGRQAPTFSARVAAGRRAVTVPVDEISSISGLLEPGDRIDVYASLDRAGVRHSVAVLTHVRVLATGQRAGDDTDHGERRLYTTMTLDLDTQQARNLILARESGRITAMLRNPDDMTLLADVPVDLAQWLRPPAPVSVVVAASPAVPVLYGGRTGPGDPAALNLLRASGLTAMPPSEPTSSPHSTAALPVAVATPPGSPR